MKRVNMAMALLLSLLLVCLFCSCKALHEAALSADETPAADVSYNEIPSAGYSKTPGAAYDNGTMALGDEEMAELLALLGFEDCDPEELGTLEFLNVNLRPNRSTVNFTYSMDKPYEETEAALTGRIKGDWETDGDGADLFITGDDFYISYSLNRDDKEILLIYMADFEAPIIKTILDNHWPAIINMPEELSGQPDQSMLNSMPEEGFLSYTREWELKDKEEADRMLEWFSGSLNGSETVYNDAADNDKTLMYSTQGVNVMIWYEKDTLTISCDWS